MTKRNKIIYWVSTIWLSLGMVSTGIIQLFNTKDEVDFITKLGFPVYIITFLGLTKLLGVVAVLIPKFPVLKEWAYAGFFFTMFGAAYSHIVHGDAAKDLFASLLLLTLTVVSWYFRPADRRIAAINQ